MEQEPERRRDDLYRSRRCVMPATAEERRTAAGIVSCLPVSVTPDMDKDREWRAQAGAGYALTPVYVTFSEAEQKRRGAASLVPFLGANVTPALEINRAWRTLAGYGLPGNILAPSLVATPEKRRSAASLVPFLVVGVTPNGGKDREWRQEAGWGYAGIWSLPVVTGLRYPRAKRSTLGEWEELEGLVRKRKGKWG